MPDEKVDLEALKAGEQYMRAALKLAARGRGLASPNPMVGCVIVHQGNIIGEGWHKKYGEATAIFKASQTLAACLSV